MGDLLEVTYGVQVLLRPGGRSDHGLVRVGEKQIDRSTPGGIRDYGEIHDNGFSWKNIIDRVLKRSGRDESRVILETAFSVSSEELDSLRFYQLVRRASLFETQFTFGNTPAMTSPSRLDSGGEHCFCFSKGNQVGNQIDEMSSKVSKETDIDIKEFLESRVFIDYYESIKKYYISLDPDDSKSLNKEALFKINKHSDVTKIFNRKMSDEDLATHLGWLVAIKASRDYKKIIEDLGMQSQPGIDEYNSERAIAILVYDETKEAKEMFKNASYDTPGIIYRWPDPQNQYLPINSTYKKPAIEKFSVKKYNSKKENAEDVILVHGLGSSKETWNSVLEDLTKNYNVTIYDQRGHGQTDIAGLDFDSQTMARDLEVIMDSHNIAKAHIVGHSMGGRTVAKFASLYPDRVRSVIVEDMHMKGRNRNPHIVNTDRAKKMAMLPSTFSDLETLYSSLSPFFTPRAIEDMMKRGTIIKNAESNTYELKRTGEKIASVELYHDQALNEDLTETLKDIKSPILFLKADRNKEPVLFGKGAEHIKENKSDAIIDEIEGAGHGIHSELPKKFVDRITYFWLNRS